MRVEEAKKRVKAVRNAKKQPLLRNFYRNRHALARKMLCAWYDQKTFL
jgi:hypothetical protein